MFSFYTLKSQYEKLQFQNYMFVQMCSRRNFLKYQQSKFKAQETILNDRNVYVKSRFSISSDDTTDAGNLSTPLCNLSNIQYQHSHLHKTLCHLSEEFYIKNRPDFVNYIHTKHQISDSLLSMFLTVPNESGIFSLEVIKLGELLNKFYQPLFDITLILEHQTLLISIYYVHQMLTNFDDFMMTYI